MLAHGNSLKKHVLDVSYGLSADLGRVAGGGDHAIANRYLRHDGVFVGRDALIEFALEADAIVSGLDITFLDQRAAAADQVDTVTAVLLGETAVTDGDAPDHKVFATIQATGPVHTETQCDVFDLEPLAPFEMQYVMGSFDLWRHTVGPVEKVATALDHAFALHRDVRYVFSSDGRQFVIPVI